MWYNVGGAFCSTCRKEKDGVWLFTSDAQQKQRG